MKNRDDLIRQASVLIQQGEKILETETAASSNSKPLVSESEFHEFRIAALSYLSRVFGNLSTYYESFKTEVTHATASRTRRGLAILQACQKDLDGDWLETTRGAVTKDILSDILKLAKVQVDLKNSKAAAIMMGTVLEELLRCLCIKAEIKLYNEIQGKAVAKKGLQLTGEAYKKKVYERQDNKQIIGWLELYQSALENKDQEVTPGKVNQMLTGLQSFLAGSSL